MILPALALGLLTQLPPNHPPVKQELPPNHPQVGMEQGSGNTQQLPANHPPFQAQQQGGAAMQQGGAPSVDELIKQLDQQPDLKTREKSFEVAIGIGKLYYAAGRRPDAIDYLKQAIAQGLRLPMANCIIYC